ncbi:MAG: alpha/beta hydrolase [Hyphomicrobium sp.]
MPEIPGFFVAALAVIASILIYVFAWRATRASSMVVKSVVRLGLLILIAVPVAGTMLVGSDLRKGGQNVDSRLATDTPADAKRVERAPRRGARRARTRKKRAARETVSRPYRMEAPASPPAAANGGTDVDRNGGGAGMAPAARIPNLGGPGAGAPPSVSMAPPPPPPPLPPSLESTLPDVSPPMAGAQPMPPAVAPTMEAAEAAAPVARRAPEPSIMAQPREAEPTVEFEMRAPAPEALSAEDTAGAAPAAPMSAEPEPSAAAVDTNKDFDVVPVFYGTDREVEPDPMRLVYNSERGRRLDLGRALVTVPKNHEVPMIERPWVIRIPYFDVTIYEEDEDPKEHFTIKDIKALTKEEFLRLTRERLAKSARFKDHAILFVHGYNTSFDHALYRAAQISYDLEFDGAAFIYSWPSGGAVASYTYDRESAGQAQPYLRKFLDLIVKQSGAKTISIIAHSMGTQPLLEVLKDLKSTAPDELVISQIILAAPDVDADTFTNLAHRIEGLAKGVTLYAASNDRALIVSRNFWQNPRAGDVPASGPLIVPGIDTIDVTAASTDTFALNHSGYAENNELLEDIGVLIEKGLRPPDQRLDKLKLITTEKGDYWRFTRGP